MNPRLSGSRLLNHGAPVFIDLFAGCGGLSLGLFEAGWRGLFAIEREHRAFSTLSHNLMGRAKHRFLWPKWLACREWSLEQLLADPTARKRLRKLHGRVDLLAGGPPCQGFSTLGKRRADDPRNQLFRQYLQIVRMVEPKLVLIENVNGISHSFVPQDQPTGTTCDKTYAEIIKEDLQRLRYEVWTCPVVASNYGVPQLRPRFLFIAAHHDHLVQNPPSPFGILNDTRERFLQLKGLNPSKPVTAAQAIADLHTEGRLEPCPPEECFSRGTKFFQASYGPHRTDYQKLMHRGMNGELPDSHRLPNHLPSTVEKFQWFLDMFGPGKKIAPDQRGRYFTKKKLIKILNPAKPSPTVTTLPDDLLHYHEPRILTVRETARLQSFPDWFQFKGKYTTGGKERVKQCPRYTQVGNAVPPLLAEAVGRALLEFRRRAMK